MRIKDETESEGEESEIWSGIYGILHISHGCACTKANISSSRMCKIHIWFGVYSHTYAYVEKLTETYIIVRVWKLIRIQEKKRESSYHRRMNTSGFIIILHMRARVTTK